MFSLSLADVPFVGSATPIQRAIAVLRKFGTDAHIWLPGVGSINGLQAANYLLSDASTGLAPVDQYVGRVSDALGGVVVNLVTNGGFDSATGWTAGGEWVIAGGVATCTFTGAYNSLDKLIPFVAGKTYDISFDIVSQGVGGVAVGITPGPTNNYIGGVGRRAVQVVAPTSPVTLRFQGQWNATTIVIDNVVVRELPGIHCTQPVAANRPKLVRGAVNLLTYSGDFTNAAWVKVGTCIVSSQTAGFPAVLDQMRQQTVLPVANGSVWTACALLSGSGTITLVHRTASGTYVYFGNTQITLTATPTLYVANGISPESVNGLNTYLQRSVGDTATSVTVGGIGLFQGTYTAAQIQALGGIPLTTTAPASTALGSWAWQFDGSNDSLALGSVPFQMGDDHCVIAGVVGSKLQTTSVALSYTANSARYAAIGSSVSYPDFIEWYDGTTYKTLEGGVSVFDTRVISARRVGGTLTGRRNSLPLGPGSRAAFDTSVQGSAAAIGNGPLGNHLGGLGCVIAIKGTVSDSYLKLLEKLVGAMSGVAIP